MRRLSGSWMSWRASQMTFSLSLPATSVAANGACCISSFRAFAALLHSISLFALTCFTGASPAGAVWDTVLTKLLGSLRARLHPLAENRNHGAAARTRRYAHRKRQLTTSLCNDEATQNAPNGIRRSVCAAQHSNYDC